MKKVIVLTGQSLLTQGIVSNLRESSISVDMETLDFSRPDLIETLIDLKPEIVILESSQSLANHGCSLQYLFEALPSLIVMEVNLKTSSVQLIRSHLYDASGFASLLNVIENVRTNLRDTFVPMPTLQHE
jgi:hypothetical protein